MLQDQRIVVVGASQGMGLETARLLADKGAKVVMASRAKEKIEAAAASIAGDTVPRVLDFTDELAVKSFFDELGAVDHVVLVGAGTPAWGGFTEFTTEALRSAFETKFFGYYFVAKHAVPHLRPGGSITFVIGGAARKAIPGTAGVAAVNGAIAAMGKTMAKELAPLRVNVLSPGLVDTPAYDWMNAEQKQAFFQQMGEQIPVGRVGSAAEIAQAIIALIENPFITGAVLDVDGGGAL